MYNMGKVKELKEEFMFRHGGWIMPVFKTGITILSVIAILGLFLGWFEEDSKVEVEEMNKELLNKYEVLNSSNIGMTDKPAIVKDILLKDPFTDEIVTGQIIDFIIENEKLKVEEETGNKLHALEIKIFTREKVFTERLNPPGTVYYQHKDGWQASFDERLAKYKNHVLEVSMIYISPQLKDYYMDDKTYNDFLRVMELSEALGGDTLGARAHMLYDLKIKDQSEEYFVKEKYYEDLLFNQINNGEPNNMFLGSGGYLLEYYKESDPKFYDLIINL
jgi:hypothetical protein